MNVAGREAAAAPTFLPIRTTWQFDPPIPHDGSFSASISLSYSADQLPDDPNFSESRLQVVSIDAAGVFHAYQTSIDLANKIATAQIDGLETPVYYLRVEIEILSGHESWESLVERLCRPQALMTPDRFFA